MTADMIRRRMPRRCRRRRRRTRAADRIIVPGRCRGDVDALTQHFGIPVQRGPEELKDLPRFFNRAAKPIDLSEYEVAIFAEIVDAPRLSVEQIVARAAVAARRRRRRDRPRLPARDALRSPRGQRARAEGRRLRGQRRLDRRRRNCCAAAAPAADYLLSLTIDTLWVADEVAATPVLIPREPSDEASLLRRRSRRMQRQGRAFLADPILDPIPFGLTASIVRYHRAARALPRGADHDGRGQPDRADRGRHQRHQRAAVRHLRRARRGRGADHAGQRACAPRGARGRLGAPHHACRASATRCCPRA